MAKPKSTRTSTKEMTFSLPPKLEAAAAEHLKKLSSKKPGARAAAGLVGGICCNG